MATDIPFWRGSTGAQQRIASLVRYLSTEKFELLTFYLGQSGTDQFTDKDAEMIASIGLDVEQKSSDQPPANWKSKIGWYADAAIHQLKGIAGSGSESVSSTSSSMTLEDFQWPWAVKVFRESVARFQPDSILIQYVKLAYLLDGIDERGKSQPIQTLIDTHDVLYQRNEQFKQRGYPHWIEISREEEAAALSRFQHILAIQEREAETFREMVPGASVVVCGHATEPCSESRNLRRIPDSRLSLGYLGSVNDSNIDAISKLLTAFEKFSSEKVRLVIAGAISDWLKDQRPDTNSDFELELLGRVDSLQEFYDRVDVVCNPVEFGTGLKIKNVEAFAFGKPLLTTPHGLSGMAPDSETACIVCGDAAEILHAAIQLVDDQDRFQQLAENAKRIAIDSFQATYAELARILDA